MNECVCACVCACACVHNGGLGHYMLKWVYDLASTCVCVCVCAIMNYAIVPLINFVYCTLDQPCCAPCIKLFLRRSGFINLLVI